MWSRQYNVVIVMDNVDSGQEVELLGLLGEILYAGSNDMVEHAGNVVSNV